MPRPKSSLARAGESRVVPPRTRGLRPLWSVLGRATRLSLILATCAVGGLLLGGCGEQGVADGATVNVYASQPLSGPETPSGKLFCGAAATQLARAGGRAGNVRLKLICLDD